MRILVWHWGRFGAGPRFAVELAAGFSRLPGTTGLLSLSAQAELRRSLAPGEIALTVPTYDGVPSLLGALARSPWQLRRLKNEVARLHPDAAVSAMPALLDPLMVRVLTRQKIPFAMVVHDAARHPGDGFPLQIALQTRLIRRADLLIALSEYVAAQIRAIHGRRASRVLVLSHPPFTFGTIAALSARDGRPFRLLFFGRLLRYKGLGLLAAALTRLPPDRFTVRVVGHGPRSDALDALTALPFVNVENRWVPEEEIATLLEWADALVLPYEEASQSGVAAAAIAAGRMIVATNVGGLAEQLRNEPLAHVLAPDPERLAACIEEIAAQPSRVAKPIAPAARWAAFAQAILPELRALRAAPATCSRGVPRRPSAGAS